MYVRWWTSECLDRVSFLYDSSFTQQEPGWRILRVIFLSSRGYKPADRDDHDAILVLVFNEKKKALIMCGNSDLKRTGKMRWMSCRKLFDNIVRLASDNAAFLDGWLWA